MSVFDELYGPIGGVLKKRRKFLRQSIPETALRAGISKGLLSRIESGKMSNPTLKTLTYLSYALSLSPSRLLEYWENGKGGAK